MEHGMHLFRNLINSTIKRSFLSTMTTCHEIIHWHGSTSETPPLTKAPLQGACRANMYVFADVYFGVNRVCWQMCTLV